MSGSVQGFVRWARRVGVVTGLEDVWLCAPWYHGLQQDDGSLFIGAVCQSAFGRH